MSSRSQTTRLATAPSASASGRTLASNYEGWDLDRINAKAEELRTIRSEKGVGAMIAHAADVPLDEWHEARGIDRPAGE